MTTLLDVPRLARDVLRHYAAMRVEDAQPVTWYEDGMMREATPAPYKGPDRWLVQADRWEQHWTKASVLDALSKADAVEVIEE